MKCFIVDDSQLYIDIIAQAIASDGDIIKSTTNPNNAIEQIIEFDPDVIVIDYIMPEKSGTQLADEINQNKITSHIPILLISAGEIPCDYRNYGIYDHIEKSEPIESIRKSLNLFSNIGKINKHTKKIK